MKSFFKFNKVYFLWAILLFGIELLIAMFAHDQILRPYVGDLLVVILIYCCVKSFVDTPVFKTAIAVLLFSYLVETSQYFHLVSRLGLQHSAIASTVLGTSFAWIDLVAYTCGIGIVLYVEIVSGRRDAGAQTE